LSFAQPQQKNEEQHSRERVKAANIRTIRSFLHIYKFGEPVKKGMRKETVTYDSLGRRIEWTSFDTTGNIVFKFKYKYDSIGNRINDFKYKSNNSLSLKIEHRYDNQGNELESVTYDSVGDIAAKTVSTFDSLGHCSEWVEYRSDGSVSDQKAYTFDRNGNLVEETQAIMDKLKKGEKLQTIKMSEEHKTFAYDGNGNMIEEVSFSAKGDIVSKISYKYDANNNLAEMSESIPQRMSKGKTLIKTESVSEKTTYAYDSKGNLSEENAFSVDGSISSKTVYTYDEFGIKTGEIYFNVKLNEPQSQTKYTFVNFQK